MRARLAYISSLGTTAILVAAALLMLALVGAIVAFKGWPGGAGEAPVHSVPLAPDGAPNRVALVRRPAVARGLERASRTKTVAKRRPVSTGGLVKDAATEPKVVPGIVMDPAPAAPMSPEPSSPGTAPQNQVAVVTPEPDGKVPGEPQDGGPVPGAGGGLPVPPLPDPIGAQPSTDQVTTMVGSLLSGGAPPPPAVSEVTSVLSIADGVLHLR
jgi:hypothetical protein